MIGDMTDEGVFLSTHLIDAIKQLSEEQASVACNHIIFDKKAQVDSSCPKERLVTSVDWIH